MKKILLLLCLPVFGLMATAQTVHLSAQSTGGTFEGIGAVNGGGATAVLLKDYPEPQRSQIMDLVYKPMFGASISTMLTEIPGDGNSTQGSMPTHSRGRGDFNPWRGYTWWVLREAVARNPQLTLDATGWSAPAWVGDIWSQDMADYYVSWLYALRHVHGLELDAIGCHNEKGYNYDFAKNLRRTMNENGFDGVRLHAFDNWGPSKLEFLDEMLRDSALAASIDIISAHTFSEIPVTAEQRDKILQLGKPLWNSEEHIYRPGFDCLITIVKCFNENYVVSGATKVVNWYDVAGVYPLEPYSHDPAMLLAREPWSGHYSVREALWGYAHYGQFTALGWRYVDDGCLLLDGGGSMATLRDPATGDYSIIIETKEAREPQTIQIKVSGKGTKEAKGLAKGKLCVWRSTADEQFARQADIVPRGGQFTLTVEPGAVYSLSTTTGQQKGSYADIPASAPFPLPYSDDFDGQDCPAAWGYLPHYTADLIGAFELTERPDHQGQCIRQVVGDHTISWAPEWHHYTLLGDSAWLDYDISADVWLNPGDEAGIMGRLCDVGSGYGIWAKGYYLKLDDQGNVSLVVSQGRPGRRDPIGDAEQQALIRSQQAREEGGEHVLASAQLADFAPYRWHTLTLRLEGERLTGFVDGKKVVSASSSQYRRGMAGLLAPIKGSRVSTPYFDNLRIDPLGRTAPTPPLAKREVKPLYSPMMGDQLTHPITPSAVQVPVEHNWLWLGDTPYVLHAVVTNATLEEDDIPLKVLRDIGLTTTPVTALETTAHVHFVNGKATAAFDISSLEPGFYQVCVGSGEPFNIGIRPEEIVSPTDRQPDFDAFWDNTLKELADVEPEYQLTLLPEHSNAQRNVYRVECKSLGGVLMGGYYCEPVAEGKYPAKIEYMGYGAEPYIFDPSAEPETIQFLVSVRGQGIFLGSTPRNWDVQGLASKETYYYRGAFADVVRAIDFVASRSKCDPDRIFAQGESQGGAFTWIAASLDSRIAAAAPAVPFLGDFPHYAQIVNWPMGEILEAARNQGIPEDELYKTLSYFDVKNFTDRITCPIYMSFGLQDPTCPPHTEFAAYNQVKSAKNYFCVPLCGHAMWLEPSWAKERAHWFDTK